MVMLQPAVVLSARVNQASFTYPIAQVAFDTVTTGDWEDVEIGMTVLFGSTAGSDDLGRQRVRGITSTVLKFGRSSQGGHDGEVNLADNAYITVWDDYRVWAKIPFIDDETGEVFKDWDIGYTDETDESPPVANAGPDMCGTIDAGTGVLRVELPPIANTSFPTADGVTVNGFNWVLPSGVTLVGGYNLTDQVIRVDCEPGFYHVRHTVTDENGKTHSTRVKIYARDPDADTSISNFQIDAHRIAQSGQTLSVRVLEDIPASTYPDGTAVMIWEGEPAGPTDRSHMVFTGWHHTDPARILAERTGIIRDTTLELLDVCGKLNTLPGFDQTIENSDAPATWLEMKDTNLDKYYVYLLVWHSTALAVADFSWSNQGSQYPFVVLGSPEATLFEQVQKRAASFVPNHVFVCNRRGQMAIKPDPLLQQTGDRTATIQATLTAADYSSLEFTHQRSPRYHWLREEAILAHATQIQAAFSIAPGDAPGQGASPVPHGEQLAKTQADLNQCAGHRYARLNAPETPFVVGLVSANGGTDLGIEPAAMTWVKLTLPASVAAQRGLAFTEARGLPLEVNITYQYERTGLIRNAVMLWERETTGNVPGVTYTPPAAPPPSQTTPPPYNPTPPPSGGGDGFGTNYVFASGVLARTRNLSAASPTWDDITGSITGTSYDFILDPWQPATRGYALTSSGVWRLTDLDTDTPTIEHILSNSDVLTGTGRGSARFWYKIEASINIEDYIAILVGTDGSGVDFVRLYCAYSEDGGDTWSYGQVDTTTNGRLHPAGGLALCPRIIGGDLMLQAAVYRSELFVGEDYYIYQSDDRGANWSQVNNLNYDAHPFGGHTMIIPFDSNTSGLIAWAAFRTDQSTAQIYKTTNGWSSFSTISLPSTTGGNTETFIKRLGIEIFAQDVNQVATWNSENRLFKSVDGSAFTEVSYSGYVPGTHGAVAAAGGFPFNGSQYYIFTANRYVFVSTDGGVNWTDKSGDIRDSIGANVSLDDSGYHAVIVPLWIEE